MIETLGLAVREALAGASDAALAVASAAVVALILALFAVLARGGGRQATMARRIAQLAADRQAADDRLADRLHAQERALADVLDRRLDATSERIGSALTGLAERLGRVDAAQSRLTALSGQIADLEKTLSNKQARGAFGEARLSDLLRDALPDGAYVEQATLKNGRRADALLLLPAPPGPIAIDAKFPLEAYLALHQAPDADAAKRARAAFARDVAGHVADIADRYIVPGATADCALMFVPSEAVYAEIHSGCRGVVEEGFRRRVFIVSPTTLWATLNTARAILKDARLQESAAALQAETLGLVEDVARLAQKAEAAKRRLELADADLAGLAQAARATERRGRRIADLDLNVSNSA